MRDWNEGPDRKDREERGKQEDTGYGKEGKKERNLLEALKNWRIRKDQVLILFLVGLLLLVISLPAGKNRHAEDASETASDKGTLSAKGTELTADAYVSRMERELEEILSQMEGAGDVRVMLTLKESAERVVEKDVETSSESIRESGAQGADKTTKSHTLGETTVYSGDGGYSYLSGSEGASAREPYVSKELTPRVEGVVVVAEGGDNAVVVKNITEAVQALFGVDTHKIRIVKKNEAS